MRFINALLVAIGVAIIVFLIGVFLAIIPPVASFGVLLQTWAWLIGIASGLLHVAHPYVLR